jgi:flagellar hook-length control protein FliK
MTEAIRTAAPRQAGLAPLFADVEQIARAPNEAQSPIPSPVRQAATDILSLRVPLNAQLAAGDLKHAFVRSGVLLEPRLAAAGGAPTGARAVSEPARPVSTLGPPGAVPTPRDDLKSALLVFREVLKTWSASFPAATIPESPKTSLPIAAQTAMQAPAPVVPSDLEAFRHIASALAGAPEEMPQGAPLSPEQASSLAKSLAAALTRRDAPAAPAAQTSNAVAPPYRGAPLAAQAIAAPSIAPDAAPSEIAHKLIAETDGALARLTLLQAASLPEQGSQPRAEAAQRWNFEVPFATPQGTAIAQFEVSRDGGASKAEPQARTWRARFTLDVEPMGPVHAMIALSGARTSVTLWAERAATATRLNEHAPRLSDALRAAELEPADFQFRVGAPPTVAKQAAPGRFMDRA